MVQGSVEHLQLRLILRFHFDFRQDFFIPLFLGLQNSGVEIPMWYFVVDESTGFFG